MIAYLVIFLVIVFQIILGFALMFPEGRLAGLNYGLFGSEVNTRIAHYIVNWVFVLFLIVHTYLAIRDSFAETKEVFMVEGSEKE